MLGTSTKVKITSVGRWSVFGDVLEFPKQTNNDNFLGNPTIETPSYPDSCDQLVCSREASLCSCTTQTCGGQSNSKKHEEVPIHVFAGTSIARKWKSRTLVSSFQSIFHRKRRSQVSEKSSGAQAMQTVEKQEDDIDTGKFTTFDWILLAGIAASSLTIITLLVLLSSNTVTI